MDLCSSGRHISINLLLLSRRSVRPLSLEYLNIDLCHEDGGTQTNENKLQNPQNCNEFHALGSLHDYGGIGVNAGHFLDCKRKCPVVRQLRLTLEYNK